MTLDDIRRHDQYGMYDLVRSFPKHWKEGRALALEADLSVDLTAFTQVLVSGMGGSAISGDLVRCYAYDQSPMPISVVRNYQMPASVNEKTLVIASSFSGNTEETLAAFSAAREAGATVICIASGGQLLEEAQKHSLPYVKIPGGMPPRAALGYSLSVLLTVMDRLGVLQAPQEAWDESVVLLEAQTEALCNPSQSNQALEVAETLKGLFPFIYSATGLLEAVNMRWRGQFQENAKMLAVGNVFPELNHNEIMGWEAVNGHGIHGSLGVVVLRDDEDHNRISHRIDVTRSLLEKRSGKWIEVESKGTHRLTRMLSLINLGDWVSLYLAFLRGVDPTPIALIDSLKQALAEL